MGEVSEDPKKYKDEDNEESISFKSVKMKEDCLLQHHMNLKKSYLVLKSEVIMEEDADARRMKIESRQTSKNKDHKELRLD